MNDIEMRIYVMCPKAGDSVVITCPHRLDKKQIEHIRSYAEGALPEGVKVLVLDGGLTATHIMAPMRDEDRHGSSS